MQELLEIAKEVIPEADKPTIKGNLIRLSWKTNDDRLRKEKRFQPIIIEVQDDFLPPIPGIQGFKFPEHVTPKIRVEFITFLRDKRSQFDPRVTENSNQSHTPEYWVFAPEA